MDLDWPGCRNVRDVGGLPERFARLFRDGWVEVFQVTAYSHVPLPDEHWVLPPGSSSPITETFRFSGVIDGGLSPDVMLMGEPAATVGSTSTNTPPHVPKNGVFVNSPSNQGKITEGSGTVQIGWRVGGRKVAPALEGAVRPRLHQLHLAIEHDAAAPDAVLVPERLDAEDALPAQHLTLDHPEQGPAVDELVDALGHHAGAVETLALLARLLAFRTLLLDPVLQVLNGIAADGELDEIE